MARTRGCGTGKLLPLRSAAERLGVVPNLKVELALDLAAHLLLVLVALLLLCNRARTLLIPAPRAAGDDEEAEQRARDCEHEAERGQDEERRQGIRSQQPAHARRVRHEADYDPACRAYFAVVAGVVVRVLAAWGQLDEQRLDLA